MDDLCPCGLPLHYTDPEDERIVRGLVAELGPNVKVTTPWGNYAVPRHFIALHGVSARQIPALAEHYGWSVV